MGFRELGALAGPEGFSDLDVVDDDDGRVPSPSVSSCFSSSSGISPSRLEGWLVGSWGSLSSSESRLWWSSSSFKVRRASILVVSLAALENSPAARVCSLMATVVSEVWVATEAARA